MCHGLAAVTQPVLINDEGVNRDEVTTSPVHL